VEARAKRAEFLREAADRLGLKRVRVVAERAEVLGRSEREEYQFAVARAVGSLPLVTELTMPLLRVGGRLLAMRGPEGVREAEAAAGVVEALGGEIADHTRFELPKGHGRRVLVLVEKRRPTPTRYPRRGGALGRFPAAAVAGR
jgi:16S rRNA (guanine527-N7)-methyltransferase